MFILPRHNYFGGMVPNLINGTVLRTALFGTFNRNQYIP